MTCKCGSVRLMEISCKHNDLASLNVAHLDIKEYYGNFPYVGSFGGDYTDLTVCLDCGQIQNWKPISDDELLADEQLQEHLHYRNEERRRQEERELELATDTSPTVITLASLMGKG